MSGAVFSFREAIAARSAREAAPVSNGANCDIESEATRLALRVPFLKARMEEVFGKIEIEAPEPKLGIMGYTVSLPENISIEKNWGVAYPVGRDDDLNRAIAKLYIHMTQYVNGVILKQINENCVKRFGYDAKSDNFYDMDVRAACGVVTRLPQCVKRGGVTPV
jgi:hypothetical protein